MTTSVVPIEIEMADQRVLHFPVAQKSKRKACFALGVRKSGSSIFSSIASALAIYNDVSVIDIPGSMFESGYRYPAWNGHPNLGDLIWPGHLYIGFRDAPTGIYEDPVFQEARKILLVRDPRDALVSEFFSNAYSHSLPKDGPAETSVIAEERGKALRQGLEDYVLKRAKDLDRTVTNYAPLIGTPNLLLMRYEDVILKKDAWIRAIAAHFGWKVEEQLVRDVLGWADVRPSEEVSTNFIRRVAPGDYLEKLSPSAIKQIVASLSPLWRKLGYEF